MSVLLGWKVSYLELGQLIVLYHHVKEFIVELQGGRHIDHVADQIVNKLIDVVKRKNKGGVNIKPFQVSLLFCGSLF